MKTSLSKRNRIVFTVSALGSFILALVWVSFFRQKSFDREDAIRFTVEKNSNLAVALEQYAISTLHNADAVLQLVRIEYAREGGALNLEKLLGKTTLNSCLTSGVVIFNNQGKLVKASTSLPNDSAAGLPYKDGFIFHSFNTADTLLISKPLPSGPMGKPVIIISRRLNNSKGGFEGMVALQMEPSKFTAFYAGARLLPNDIISLIAPDGITYARRTGNRESSGEDIYKSPLFSHLAQHADSFYFAPDAIKNIPTWFSYRRLKEYPIIATVGSSEPDIFANYAIKQSRFIMPRIILSVVVFLFSLSIALILIRRLRILDQLAEDKERYERLLTEQMIAGQERERERIGRELHDNISQVLTTVKLYLEMASKQEGQAFVARSMQLVNSSITEIRNLSHQLSAPTLGTRSLIDAINALIETVGYSSNLVFEFDHRGYSDQLNMSQKLALYRIVQEQMNNILKHANATRVWIRLNQKNDRVLLTVRDNGEGFDPGARSNGMGLNNITSRIKVFDGDVHIESAPKKGCFLKVSFPLAVSKEEEEGVIHNRSVIANYEEPTIS